MKTQLLMLLLSIFSLSIYAQQPTFPPSNGIENRHIVVVNKAKKTYVSGGSTNKLVNAFGKTKVEKEADEVLGGFAYTYIYQGLEVYFNGKNWEGMDVKTNDYIVLLNGHPIAVGDNINKLSQLFPLSYKNRTKEGMHLNITYKGKPTDAFVSFNCNAKGIINLIIIANDNS